LIDRTSKRVKILLAVGAVALLGVVGCSAADPQPNQPSGAQVVASFEGGEITQGEVQAEVDRFGQQTGAGSISPGSPQWDGIKDQVMQQLVTAGIARAYAEENGITVSEEEVQQQIDETREGIAAQAEQAGQGGREPEQLFQEALAQAGYTEGEFRELVREGLIVQKVQEEVTAGVEPTGEDVQTYYDENLEAQFTTPEQRCVRHILFNQDQEELANEVRQQLEDGGNWEELAAEHSQDPGSREQGGDLGCQPQGVYVENFDNAVWEAETGEIVGPVETEFGFHVLEVTEVQEEDTTPLEEARPVILDTLTQEQQAEAFNRWVEEQIQARDVTYLPDYRPAPLEQPAPEEEPAPEE
jgi:peptidyl-prolyl cis-trans isomerase C